MLPLGCALWRASAALPAVWIESSGGYEQSCGPSLALVGQQLLGRSSLLLLVSYTASLARSCELVLSPHTVLDAVRIDKLAQGNLGTC